MIKVVTWKSKCNNHLSPISWLKIVKFTDFTKLQGKLVSRNFFCTVLWKKQKFLLICKNVREINSHKTLISRKFCWTKIVKVPQCYFLEKFVKSIDFCQLFELMDLTQISDWFHGKSRHIVNLKRRFYC